MISRWIIILTFVGVNLLSKIDAQIQCGTIPTESRERSISARIFGGVGVKYGSVPWQINLFQNKVRKCGATIVQHKWIMSAAHCVIASVINQNFNFEYTAIAGDHDITKKDFFEQFRYVVRVVIHPDYNQRTLENDIALLEVDQEFEYDNYVVPACLPYDGESPYPYTTCTVSGWGYSNFTHRPNVLQKLDLPVLLHKFCEAIHHPNDVTTTLFTNRMLCAGHLEGGKDSCQGDSGGPLVCPRYGSNAQGEKVLAGIVSWGRKCGEKGSAGVYTDVSSYMQWINETLSLPPIYNSDPCKYSGVKIRNLLQRDINSPGYERGKYSNNLRCTWEVDLSDLINPTNTVLIQFENLDVEEDPTKACRYDYVKIYTGDNLNTLQGTFCGTKTPNALTLRRTTSSNPSLRFKVFFHSDNSVGRKGFQIKFKVL